MSNLPTTNLIPSVLTDAKVYKDGNALLGVADIELPSFEYKTESLTGLGIAGDVEIPVQGHFASMKVKFTWNTTTSDAVKLLNLKAHQLDIRGSIQSYDAGTGEYKDEAIKVLLRTTPKNVGLGKAGPAKKMEATTELEVAYIKITQSGTELVELDKFNYVFKVLGEDKMATIRQNLGMN